MKKKRNTRSKIKDILVVLLFLFIAGTGLYLFWNDLNRSLTKLNEQPIATITYKYRVAQRRFIDRLIWDRLQQNTPLYNGDTIRTAAQAEATIHFIDNSIMELQENSIAQVFLDTEGAAEINFSGGGIRIDATAAQTGVRLRSGNASVQVSSGSELAAHAAAQSSGAAGDAQSSMPLTLQVLRGSAALTDAQGAGVQSLAAGSTFNVDAAGAVSQTILTVTSPTANAKVLSMGAETVPVDFSWTVHNLPERSNIILETAQDRDFTALVEQIAISGLQNVTLDIPAGITWWRIYAADGSEPIADAAVSGRIQVLDTPKPELTVPANNDVFSYRTKHPALRFVWTGNEYAASYLLEIADNPDMQNPLFSQQTQQMSSIISTLGAGSYYWRVTPFYVINNTGAGPASAVGQFSIEQRGALVPPELNLPEANGFINTDAQDERGSLRSVFFSWQNDPEAASYRIRISRSSDLSAPAVDAATYANTYQVVPAQANITDGRWYWGVTTTDIEGNTSAVSEIRSFTAVKGDIVFYTVFPPAEYNIADSRMFDIKFTWKNNIPGNLRFQIARDVAFGDILVDDVLDSSILSISSKTLAVGDYYWRIATQEPVGGNEPLYTEPKRFHVLPPLDAPVQTVPAAGERLIVYPDTPSRFEWLPAAEADYYQFALYESGSLDPLYQNNFVGDAFIELDLQDMPNGYYYWTVQAISEETMQSTRRTGTTAQAAFRLIPLHPIELYEPQDGVHIGGLDAYYNPPVVSWHSPDPLRNGQSRFTLAESPALLPASHAEAAAESPRVIMTQHSPPERIQLPRLTAGTYYWNVTGITVDDLDVTPRSSFSFTVDPIPPFPAVPDMTPPDGSVFDETYLVNTLSLQFTWQSVPDAEAYVFTVYKENAGTVRETVISEMIPADAELSYLIEDISVLDVGSFVWTVEAVRLTDDGEILQHGVTEDTAFSVTLPEIPQFTVADPGELYGN